ncbi:hypothetical protein AK812_SmicGene7498 [Symbiodinium microadriaticum]|uniref:Sulfotransferase domain-containing protein n=1 Tax=Symbiodinium microadriaticum TaxID=2951 RepID=A0A1Q9END1_SYMMI|nr:hypothetical protein AK812_SmicGene7498 [Symbiodinium microadriaticum]
MRELGSNMSCVEERRAYFRDQQLENWPQFLRLLDMYWGLEVYDKEMTACFQFNSSCKTDEGLRTRYDNLEITKLFSSHTAVGFTWHWCDGWPQMLGKAEFVAALKERCVRIIFLERTNAVAHALASSAMMVDPSKQTEKKRVDFRKEDKIWSRVARDFRKAYQNVLNAGLPSLWIPYETLSRTQQESFQAVLDFLELPGARLNMSRLSDATKHHKGTPLEYLDKRDIPRCEKDAQPRPFRECFDSVRACMLNDTCSIPAIRACGHEKMASTGGDDDEYDPWFDEVTLGINKEPVAPTAAAGEAGPPAKVLVKNADGSVVDVVKKEGRLMRKIILGLSAVILLLLTGTFILSYMAVDMAKEMRGEADGVMQTPDGEVVKVASSAFDVQADGTVVTRGEATCAVPALLASAGVQVTPTCPANTTCRRLASSPGVLQVAQSKPGKGLVSTLPDDVFKPVALPAREPLVEFLKIDLPGCSLEERIRNAYLLGPKGAAIVRGDRSCFETSSNEGRKVVYVILAADSISEPVHTTSLIKYLELVKTGPGKTFDPTSVSRGFPSLVEAEAFARGAGAPEYLGDWHTAEHPSGYSKLYLSYEGFSSQCFIVKAVETGMMICVPQGGIATSVLEQAAEAGYEGILGPWKLISVAAVSSAGGRELKKTVACLIIDLALSGLDLLSAEPKSDFQQVTFGTVRLQSVWPSRLRVLQALEEFINGEEVEAFDRLEPYITGDDGVVDSGGPPGLELPGSGSGGADSSDLLQQLLQTTSSKATLLSGLQDRLQSLDQVERRLAQLESRPSGSAAAPTTPASPAWAPQLFAEGESAQLTPDQVQQLLVLAGRAPRTLGDLPGPSAPWVRTGGTAFIEKELRSTSSAPVFDRGGRRGSEAARREGDGCSTTDAGTLSEGPTLVYNKVKERLAQARRKPGVGDLEPRDMYLHFQETVLLGSFKTLTYVSFLLCTAWEAMENGRGDEVASIIARGLVFCEQVANESGHTRLAWLLTCLDDPPLALVESRKAPRAEVPHGMLADPRWIAAQLGYLRDAQQERTSAVHGQPTTAPPNHPEGPKSRGKRGKGAHEGTPASRSRKRRHLLPPSDFSLRLVGGPAQSAMVSMIHRLEGMVSTWIRLGWRLRQ